MHVALSILVRWFCCGAWQCSSNGWLRISIISNISLLILHTLIWPGRLACLHSLHWVDPVILHPRLLTQHQFVDRSALPGNHHTVGDGEGVHGQTELEELITRIHSIVSNKRYALSYKKWHCNHQRQLVRAERDCTSFSQTRLGPSWDCSCYMVLYVDL